MKKVFTLSLFLIFSLSVLSQKSPITREKENLKVNYIPGTEQMTKSMKSEQPLPEKPIPDKGIDIVEVVDLGTAGRLQTYWKKLSYLWVDPVLNTVTNIHNMGGSLDSLGNWGDIGYDISKDGGETWQNMVEVYAGEEIRPGMYVNHGIFNPDGNTYPDEAYITFFGVTLPDESDDTQWRYLNGVGKIDGSYQTSSSISSDERFYQNPSPGFDISSLGTVINVDANTDWTGGSTVYLDSLIVTTGIWDWDVNDFIYSRNLLEALLISDLEQPIDIKVAFGPDGYTGYIVMLGNNGEAEEIEGFKNLYPIYWKTVDGGETWSQPNYIQLDGPNGIHDIVDNLLTDEQLGQLFGDPLPPRDEVSYTTAYDCDIAVDKYGNLHIAVVAGANSQEAFGIISAPGFCAALDIYTDDGGETWQAMQMGRIRTFRAFIDDVHIYDNRIHITTNPDGDRIFISWLDTDLEDEEENNRPNIWCRGFRPFPCQLTANYNGEPSPTNVTNYSDGMWQAYFAVAPKYCFDLQSGDNIPFVYVELDEASPETGPIQFKYVKDFEFNSSDWVSCIQDINENALANQSFFIDQNQPNPVNNTTTIEIALFENNEISISVLNLTGQEVMMKEYGFLQNGKHTLQLDLSDLYSGVYFYTVTNGVQKQTRKMVVK